MSWEWEYEQKPSNRRETAITAEESERRDLRDIHLTRGSSMRLPTRVSKAATNSATYRERSDPNLTNTSTE